MVLFMAEKADNPGYITRAEFNAKFGKVELALFGPDGRGGMVRQINDMEGFQRTVLKSLRVIEKQRNEEKKAETTELKRKKRDWRALGYSVLGGLIVAAFSCILARL